jgi:hypothetical protein
MESPSNYEGVTHLLEPSALEYALASYVVLGVAAISESMSFTVAVKDFRKQKGRRGIWETVRQSKGPTTFRWCSRTPPPCSACWPRSWACCSGTC